MGPAEAERNALTLDTNPQVAAPGHA